MAKKADNHETDGKAKADRKTPAPVFPTLSAAEVSYANELAQKRYEATEESVIRYAILTSDPEVNPHTISEREIEKKVYDEVNRRRAAREPSASYQIGKAPVQAEAGAPAAGQPGEEAELLERIDQLEQDMDKQYNDLTGQIKVNTEYSNAQISFHKEEAEKLAAEKAEQQKQFGEEIGAHEELLEKTRAQNEQLSLENRELYIKFYELETAKDGAKPPAPKPAPHYEGGQVTVGGSRTKAEAVAAEEAPVEENYNVFNEAEAKAILADLTAQVKDVEGTELAVPAVGYLATAEINYDQKDIDALKAKRDNFQAWKADYAKSFEKQDAKKKSTAKRTVSAPVKDEAKEELAEIETANLINGLANEEGKLLERYGKEDAEVKDFGKYVTEAAEARKRGDFDGVKRIVTEANAYKVKADKERAMKADMPEETEPTEEKDGPFDDVNEELAEATESAKAEELGRTDWVIALEVYEENKDALKGMLVKLDKDGKLAYLSGTDGQYKTAFAQMDATIEESPSAAKEPAETADNNIEADIWDDPEPKVKDVTPVDYTPKAEQAAGPEPTFEEMVLDGVKEDTKPEEGKGKGDFVEDVSLLEEHQQPQHLSGTLPKIPPKADNVSEVSTEDAKEAKAVKRDHKLAMNYEKLLHKQRLEKDAQQHKEDSEDQEEEDRHEEADREEEHRHEEAVTDETDRHDEQATEDENARTATKRRQTNKHAEKKQKEDDDHEEMIAAINHGKDDRKGETKTVAVRKEVTTTFVETRTGEPDKRELVIDVKPEEKKKRKGGLGAGFLNAEKKGE